MAQEQFTIIITSSAGHKTRILSIGKIWIKVGAALGFLALFAMAFLSIDYAQLRVQDLQGRYLKSQNLKLQSQVTSYSEKMELIQVNLDKINQFSSKLKLIVSGESESDRQLQKSLGTPILAEAQEQEALSSYLTPQVGMGSKAAKGSKSQDLFPIFKGNKQDYSFLNPIKEANLNLAFEKVSMDAKTVERELTLLFEQLASKRDLLAATPSVRPAGGGWVSSGFGYRKDPFTGRARLHKGMDFAASIGTPVYAPAEGVVSFAGREGGYGKIISIDHGYGIVTRYAHNSRLMVKTGDRVSRWEKIAEIGNTGRSSGPHLHYEVRVNGVPVNPEKYILNN